MTTANKLITLINHYIANDKIPIRQYHKLWELDRNRAHEFSQLMNQYMTEDNCTVTYDVLVITLGAIFGYNSVQWDEELLTPALTQCSGILKI